MFVRFVALFSLIFVGVSQHASADELKDAATKASQCRTISDDTARLACLDAAALALSLALESPSFDAPAIPEPLQEPVAEAPKEPEWAKAPEPRQKPKKQAAVAAPAPEADAEAEKEKNVPIWARVFLPSEDEEENIYAVTVTRITRNNAGRHFFHTNEGQVWRQTVAGKVRPPKSLPAEAKIEQKIMGSPGLSFVGGPTGEYTVRRIE